MSPYRMELSLNILNHLGLNLYSNAPAVLSEVVANAWDADAEEVKIDIDSELKKIIISDNGSGMELEDINNKFLTIGYAKRLDKTAKVVDNTVVTDKYERTVMGRKGIGKLSLFSIAENIVIVTIKNGTTNAFCMNVPTIKKCIESGSNIYKPNKMELSDIDEEIFDGFTRGTKIILSDLKKSRVGRTATYLRKRLARRFAMIGEQYKFQVFINGEEISVEDRDYFHKIQYIWYYGNESKEYADYSKNAELKEERDNAFSYKTGSDTKLVSVKGWLGLVKQSGDLKETEETENLNKITVLIRKKLAQEDILEEFSESGLYTKFLIGEIHADFLDDDNQDDIATSSRQKIIEDDPRYIALKEFIKRELKFIEKKRVELKEEHGLEEALKYPSVEEWYKRLKPNAKKRARKLFEKFSEVAENEIQEKQLLKYGIYAFESLRYREALDAIDELTVYNVESFVTIFGNYDEIEATLYHEITSGRLKIIKKLKETVDKNELERVLQQHIFEHLWLLDPSWDRATSNPLIEERVTTDFKTISDKLSEDEKKGRMDIKYTTTSGKHVIVELKRASVPVHSDDLSKQVRKYMSALKKQLEVNGREHEPIEAVCVIGDLPIDWTDEDEKENSIQSMSKRNIRVITYDQLIHDSFEAYKAYTEKTAAISQLQSIINRIDDDLSIEEPNDS